MERPRVAVIGDPCVRGRVPFDPNPIAGKPRLDAERATRPPLAGEAVAHRDANGLTLRHQAEPATAAGGVAVAHVVQRTLRVMTHVVVRDFGIRACLAKPS